MKELEKVMQELEEFRMIHGYEEDHIVSKGIMLIEKLAKRNEKMEYYEKFAELFVKWNERQITDEEFAQTVVKELGTNYIRISEKIEEEKDEAID